MRIKKLELVGFKSFKDRTVIQFDGGITGIVGPNGCGKSNIVDGLMWVMGEMSAKDLRGSSMTDVIFAGAEGYAPLGMCEVSLTLENDGGPFPIKYARFSELMVTRRLYRSGEGEYFINKEPARLKDVQEIFMDTGAGSKGFSIIAQGMIGRIITAKPEDRKMLIEEAAGITKFKARKKESQRKLQATDQNLVRLQDIIGELKRQIDSLQRQAQRAERYRAIKSEIEDLDLSLSTRQFLDLKQAAEQAQSLVDELKQEDSAGVSSLSQIESELETLRLELLEIEKEVELGQSDFFRKQELTSKKQMEIQELRFGIEQARESEKMTGSLMQEQQTRQEILNKEQKQLSLKTSEIQNEVEVLKTEFLERNEIFQSSQERIHELDEELTTKRRELFALIQTLTSLETRAQGLEHQREDQSSKLEHERLVLSELEKRRQEFQERKEKVFEELKTEEEKYVHFASQEADLDQLRKIKQQEVQEKRTQVEEFKDQLNQVTSRLYGLENLQNNFEGFNEGVKSVMMWHKAQRETQIHSDGSAASDAASILLHPVSEAVEVPAEYEVAMEAALGTRLQILLSQDSQLPLAAVEYLKEKQTGRSSFLIDELSAKAPARDADPMGQSGVLGRLRDVISYSGEHQNILGQLVDSIAIVEDIRAALRLRPDFPGWSFVTKDGDSLSSEGVLTGGSRESADSGVLKRHREIKELSASKQEWAGKLALVQTVLSKLEIDLHDLGRKWEEAQKQKIAQEIQVTSKKKDVERSEYELANADSAVLRQTRECSKMEAQIVDWDQKLGEIHSHILQSKERRSQLESETEDLNQEFENRKLSYGDLQGEVADRRAQLASKEQEANGFARQLEMVSRSLADLNLQLSKMSGEVRMFSEKLSSNQIQIEERRVEFERLVQEAEQMKSSLAERRNLYEIQSERVRELEDEVRALNHVRNERQHRITDATLKFEQSKMKEQYLVDQVRERYMLNLPELVEKYQAREFVAVEFEAQLGVLRERLSKIGDVNLTAIEEFAETSKRYEFLNQQYEDLIESKDQLRKVIERINKICSKRFKETFDQVNERFTRVFPVLFGGGEARLELHEDVESGEMGIDIIAKPPGKKMQNVSLLSGGEKALTAVSLIFSIFLVKPSPYCLLDEVDAPLDDANVSRFNDLVREMSKRSQIILVTHNKYTMEVAGRLYGVTMQEKGVSTMVSVNLQDVS